MTRDFISNFLIARSIILSDLLVLYIVEIVGAWAGHKCVRSWKWGPETFGLKGTPCLQCTGLLLESAVGSIWIF